MGGAVRGELAATFLRRDINEPAAPAKGRRPKIGAARNCRADPAHDVILHRVSWCRVHLHVFCRIVIHRPPGLGVDAFGPGHLPHGLDRLEELAVDAVEDVSEAVACSVEKNFTILAVHPGVNQHVAAGLVVVVAVIGRVLVKPFDLAGRSIEGYGAVGVKIVAGSVARIKSGDRVPRSPIGEIGSGIVSAGAVKAPPPVRHAP
jgi:hypothetical protein